MSQFQNIDHLLEGAITNQLVFARHHQGIWDWYNGLKKVMSEQRFTGTPRVIGPTQLSAGANVHETGAVRLFGLLIDNSDASNALFVAVSNVAATPGTTNTLGYFYVPAATIGTYLIPNGLVFSSRFETFAVLGTEAGLEAGTAATTQPTVIYVYTE